MPNWAVIFVVQLLLFFVCAVVAPIVVGTVLWVLGKL